MATKVYVKSARTGGGATALDGINGDLLTDGDLAFVTVSEILYTYRLNASSSYVEIDPYYIIPDRNYGTKCWVLQGPIKSGDSGVGLELGITGSGNRYSYIDFHGDDTYTDSGLRIIRYNTGANTTSAIEHKGTGQLNINAVDAGTIGFYTTNTLRLTISGTSILSTLPLEVPGSSQFWSATNTGQTAFTAGIQVRESLRGASGSYQAPRIGFHWGNVVASDLLLNTAGNFLFMNSDCSAYQDIKASAFYPGGNASYYWGWDAGNTAMYTNANINCQNIYWGTGSNWLSAYLNQSVKTDASPALAGLTVNGAMDLSASGDSGLRITRTDQGTNLKKWWMVVDSSALLGFHTLNDNGTYISMQMTISRSGDFYVVNNCSALSFTDRTKGPIDKKHAYDILNSVSFKKQKQDYDGIHKDLKVEAGGSVGRDLSMLVSCLTVALNDITKRLEKLEGKNG